MKKRRSLKKTFNSAALGISLGIATVTAGIPSNNAYAQDIFSIGFTQYTEDFDMSQCKNLIPLRPPAQISPDKKPDPIVKDKQQLLKTIGIHVIADGFEGQGTRRAVSEFQLIFGPLYNRNPAEPMGNLSSKDLEMLKSYSKEIAKHAKQYNIRRSTAAAILAASAYTKVEFRDVLNAALGRNFSIPRSSRTKEKNGLYSFDTNNWLYMIKNKGAQYSLGFYSNQITQSTDKNGIVKLEVKNPFIFEQILNLKENDFISAVMQAEYLKDQKTFPKFKEKPAGKFEADLKKQQRALITLGFDLGPSGADGWHGLKTYLALQQFQLLYNNKTTEASGKLSDKEADLLFMYAKQAKKDEAKYNIPSPVVAAIRTASIENNFDFAYMMELAETESSFRHDVKSNSSSAKGLYQFIEATWMHMLKEHGTKYGLANIKEIGNNPIIINEFIKLRANPRLSALISVDFQKDNLINQKCYLNGKDLSRTDLYLAHFLGINDSTVFLKKLNQEPESSAADSFSAAAKYNKYVFYEVKGRKVERPRTMSEVYSKFGNKFNRGVYDNPTILAARSKFKRSKGLGGF